MWELRSVINSERNSDYEVKFWWRDDDVFDSTEELKELNIKDIVKVKSKKK